MVIGFEKTTIRISWRKTSNLVVEIKHDYLSIIATGIRSGRLHFCIRIKMVKIEIFANSTHGYLFCMQSDEILCWVYELHKNKSSIIGLLDFKLCK